MAIDALMTPAKIMLAITAMFAVLFGVAMQSIPGPKSAPTRVSQERTRLFDAAWQDPASLQKSDRLRIVSTEPQPVVTERVVAVLRDDPVTVPPVVGRPVLDKPRAEKRRRYTSAAEPEICARHGMHRVVSHGGKSWRCRR